jgi:hypothetical protein
MSLDRRPRDARRSESVSRASTGRDSAFLKISLSVTRRGPERRSGKCLYLQAHVAACEHPLNGRGGASLDRKRVRRAAMAALQQLLVEVMPTACHGLVKRISVLCVSRTPATRSSLVTFIRRRNHENKPPAGRDACFILTPQSPVFGRLHCMTGDGKPNRLIGAALHRFSADYHLPE